MFNSFLLTAQLITSFEVEILTKFWMWSSTNPVCNLLISHEVLYGYGINSKWILYSVIYSSVAWWHSHLNTPPPPIFILHVSHVISPTLLPRSISPKSHQGATVHGMGSSLKLMTNEFRVDQANRNRCLQNGFIYQHVSLTKYFKAAEGVPNHNLLSTRQSRCKCWQQ
jgi:hypothetical protein